MWMSYVCLLLWAQLYSIVAFLAELRTFLVGSYLEIWTVHLVVRMLDSVPSNFNWDALFYSLSRDWTHVPLWSGYHKCNLSMVGLLPLLGSCNAPPGLSSFLWHSCNNILLETDVFLSWVSYLQLLLWATCGLSHRSKSRVTPEWTAAGWLDMQIETLWQTLVSVTSSLLYFLHQHGNKFSITCKFLH